MDLPDLSTMKAKLPEIEGGDVKPKTALSEADFLRQVLELAKLRGWRTAHFRTAMTSKGRWVTAVSGDGKGFPDVILVRGSVIVAAELKVGKNKATTEQTEWLTALMGAGVRSFIWRPENWPLIEEVLA